MGTSCSHVAWRDINVIYYLKCNMCDHKETYIGKTIGDVIGFKINNGISTCKFTIHVYHCAINNKCLKEINLSERNVSCWYKLQKKIL